MKNAAILKNSTNMSAFSDIMKEKTLLYAAEVNVTQLYKKYHRKF